MTSSAPSSNLGRHVFGMAVLASGLITLAWHDYNDLHQLRYIAYAATTPRSLAALDSVPSERETGAVVLGAVYLVLASLCVPRIVATPQIYNSWGNFFEQFSLVTGAAIVYARLSAACHRKGLIESAEFFSACVPLPLPSNRRFIFTLRPILFRSGFHQVRCFGR